MCFIYCLFIFIFIFFFSLFLITCTWSWWGRESMKRHPGKHIVQTKGQDSNPKSNNFKKQNHKQSRFKDPLKEDIEVESQPDPNHTFAFTMN